MRFFSVILKIRFCDFLSGAKVLGALIGDYKTSVTFSKIHAENHVLYNSFIRTVAAALVSFISEIMKIDLTGLFDLRPFTKIISWGRQFKNLFEYHDLNDLEAFGYIKRDKKDKEKSKQKKRS